MTYAVGSASSFADLKTAIENHLVTNGWTLSADVLSKNGCYFQIQQDASGIFVEGGTGRDGTGVIGRPDQQGTGFSRYWTPRIFSASSDPMVFPIAYEIHCFTDVDEVYIIVRFNGGFYSHIAFGKSAVAGIGGTGAWMTGSTRASSSNRPSTYRAACINGSGLDWSFLSGSGGSTIGCSTGMFTDGNTDGPSWVQSGLDSLTQWANMVTGTASPNLRLLGSSYCAGMIASLPNLMNQATVLLPVKAFLHRSDRRRTTVLDLRHARYLRTDNVEDGGIVQFGGDEWKVYPFLRRETSNRNVAPFGTSLPHSGTYGFAIRYEGP